MSSSDASSNATPPPIAHATSTYICMMILACSTLCYDLFVCVIHKYIAICALCEVYVKNTCWMNKLILKY